MAIKGEQIDQTRALRMLCAAIFGRNNPTSTDFEDVGVWKIQRNYEQDKNGRFRLLVAYGTKRHPAKGRGYTLQANGTLRPNGP